jgi:SHO1 osmosensor
LFCSLFAGKCFDLHSLDGNVGVLWFAIFLQLFLTIGVVYTLASDSIAMHRFQIATFGSVAIVFAVQGANQGIYSPLGAIAAYGAGYLILAIVDIIWVLYFTSEEDSLMLHIFNSWGTGGLTPPSRRRRTRGQSIHNVNTGGYVPSYHSGGGIGSHDMAYDKQSPSAGPKGFSSDPPAVHSPGGVGNGANHSLNNPPLSGAGSLRESGDNGLHSPLMGTDAAPLSAGNATPAQDPAQPLDSFTYRARAMFAC